MLNALLGMPMDFTVPSTVGTPSLGSKDNVVSDEPGLICRTSSLANNTNFEFYCDVAGTLPVGLIAMLGLNPGTWTWQVQSYLTSANRAAGTNVQYDSGFIPVPFSANRASPFVKALLQLPTARNERFWRIIIKNATGATATQDIWRILFAETLQPVTNMEVGPSLGIDDRSERRYSRMGGRVIDPTLILPTFSGQWPWITVTETRQLRRWMIQKGSTYPWIFWLDPGDTTDGEDYFFYGDIEKSVTLDLDNDDMNTFKFAIVSIAA
jgi:hypothetical protein